MAEDCSANSSNILTSDELLELKYKPGTSTIVLGVLPTLMILGSIFNVAFLFVVYRAPKMRTVTNLFLVQLSITDIYTLIGLSTRSIWPYIRSPEYSFSPGSGAGCVFHDFSLYFTYFVGVNFICMVAVERYLAICRPIKHRMFKGRSYVRNASLICWFVGFLLAVTGLAPQIDTTLCAKIPDESSSEGFTWMAFHTCIPSCTWCYNMLLVYDTVQFFIIFTANSILYFLIIRKLMAATAKTTSRANKASQDVARMLIINGVAFFLLLGPYQIWNIAYLVRLYTGVLLFSNETIYWLGFVVRVCSPTNFTINPLIYGGSNSLYRQAFLEVFGCSRFVKPWSKDAAPSGSSVSTSGTALDKIKEDKSGDFDSEAKSVDSIM